jgi:hypothetical protein
MIDVMFWRRRRPWWQRFGAGFELKAPSFEAPEVEMPRFRAPWADGRRFAGPQLPGPYFWARPPRQRRFEMPQLQMPSVDAPSFEAPRVDLAGGWARWRRRFEMPRAGMPDAPAMPYRRFDVGGFWPYLAAAALAGGLLVYFLDPQMGRRRRAMARDRLLAQFRYTGRRLARTGRGVGAWGYGMSQRATHPRFAGGEAVDDVALVDRVKSELYRHDVPRSHLSVNAARGIVELRGQLDDPAEIERVESLVRGVPGVYDVHNYLHTPGTPAPNKADALSFR